jgi:hypothetical protein
MEPADPIELLSRLDADAIAWRLDDLEHQAKALRVLLRSARARENAAARRQSAQERKGVPDAA